MAPDGIDHGNNRDLAVNALLSYTAKYKDMLLIVVCKRSEYHSTHLHVN